MNEYQKEGQFWGAFDARTNQTYGPGLTFRVWFCLPLSDPNYPVFEKAYRKAYHIQGD